MKGTAFEIMPRRVRRVKKQIDEQSIKRIEGGEPLSESVVRAEFFQLVDDRFKDKACKVKYKCVGNRSAYKVEKWNFVQQRSSSFDG